MTARGGVGEAGAPFAQEFEQAQEALLLGPDLDDLLNVGVHHRAAANLLNVGVHHLVTSAKCSGGGQPLSQSVSHC